MFRFLVILALCFAPSFLNAQDNNPIEVTADNALEWDRANKTFTATGNAIIKQGDSSINAPSITAFYDEADTITIRQVIAEPNAVLIQPTETLKARKVTADFNKGVLGTVTAINNVVLETDTETLYGDKAIYNANDRIVIVTGNVRIEQDKNVLTGNQAIFDLNTNISTMTASPETGSRVKATFYSSGQ